MLAFLAPFLTGAVVGWMIFYFIRKYDRFTPKTLLGTLSALLGGDVTAFLLTMSEKFSGLLFHLRYFAGAGSGFFLYAVYILIVNILYNRGKIRDKGAYGRFTAGGGPRWNASGRWKPLWTSSKAGCFAGTGRKSPMKRSRML